MNRILLTVIFLSSLFITATAKIVNDKKYGDWKGTCQGNECGVLQVVENANNTPVGRVFIRKVPEAKNAIVIYITLPLGVNLRAHMAVAVDTKEVAIIPFDFCDQGGCHAAAPLSKEVISKIKSGNKMQVAAFVGEEQQTIEFSLKGVTDSINNL